jgi:hypothetical protein
MTRIEAIQNLESMSAAIQGEFCISQAERDSEQQELIAALSALGVTDAEMMAAGVRHP